MECIDSCRKSLDICIHLLTSIDIANSIIDAHKRGVNVRFICDNAMSSIKASQIYRLKREGINVKIPILNYHMHCKIAIIDDEKVLIGSVNWTLQGMFGNWDNIIITSQKDIVQDAVNAFNFIWNNSMISMFT